MGNPVAAGVNRFRHSVHRDRFAMAPQGHRVYLLVVGGRSVQLRCQVDHESAAAAAAKAAHWITNLPRSGSVQRRQRSRRQCSPRQRSLRERRR